MQRFSPLALILCFLCISHLPILHAISDGAEPDTCSSILSLLNCTDSGSLFSRAGLCAPLVKSNCSIFDQLTTYWDAFKSAISDHAAAPALEGISHTGNYIYINLIWDNIPSRPCDAPFAADDAAVIIPEVINLTTFANGALQFSSNDIYLLFNCNHTTTPNMVNLEENSLACQDYQDKCSNPEIESCVQLKPFQELELSKTLRNLSCTHFYSSLVNNTSSLTNWISTGMVQLVYGEDSMWCEACADRGGQCIFDKISHQFDHCQNHSTNSCKGFSCTKVKIAAVTVVGTTVFVLLVVLSLCSRRKYFPSEKVPKRSMMQEVLGPNHSFSHLDLDGLTERSVEYSYASIVSATDSFSNLLGEGGFGVVYKGTLTHANDDLHMQIAVKVLQVRSKHSKKQFLNEVATIGRIHHVHVVRLLGFCVQQNHEMLVYEYVINGSLDNWLFNHNHVLNWGQRYAIAVGIAKGLSYLHEECRHRIVHCDIKPQNILLDGHMCPKIADFGLARLMNREESRVTTFVRGTPGYMAPEFWMGGESQLSTKFDVYSYGMVLLELMTGRRNFSGGFSFPEVAFEAAMRGDFESIMDVKLGITKPPDAQSMKLDSMQLQQVRTTLLVALWCIQDHPRSRPSMNEVVQYLEGKAAINQQPPPPAIASTLSISAQQHSYLSKHHHYSITPISGGR